MRAVGGALGSLKRNKGGGDHARNRRVHARHQHQPPQQRKRRQIGPDRPHAPPVHRRHARDHAACRCQRAPIDAMAIGHRDNRDRAHIIDNRHRRQEQLERGRHPRPQQRHDANRKCDIGRRRNRPAAHQRRIPPGDQQIDQRGCGHPRRSGNHRQAPPRGVRQFAVDQLALDLQPDEQEKQRHQAVIDPQMHCHRPDRRREHRPGRVVERIVIEFARHGHVGNDQRGERCRDQHDPANRFAAQKSPERRGDPAALCSHSGSPFAPDAANAPAPRRSARGCWRCRIAQ